VGKRSSKPPDWMGGLIALWEGRARVRVLIVANGTGRYRRQLQLLARSADLVIAADGGADVAARAGVDPDVLIGDMDSVTPATRARLEARRADVREVPPEKDQTDAELALEIAAQRGASEVWLAAALGGRVDHAVANLLLVFLARQMGVRLSLIDGRTEACLVGGPVVLDARVGDIVSLIPLTPVVEGIKTVGLRYPLQNESLVRGATRGISNVVAATPAGLAAVGAGDLLLVHTRKRLRAGG
jgi:thiamine pyrophosphokinase